MVRFFKFGVVGASGALLGLSVLYLLTEEANLHYLVSYILAFVTSVCSNYLLNSLWTFKQGRTISAWSRYLLVSSCTLTFNLGLMFLFTSFLGVWYMLSAVLVTGIVFLANFILSRRFVWKNA